MTLFKTPFNFEPFYQKYVKLYPNNILPSYSFLEWLIGFTEGEGSFTIAARGDLYFVLTQSTNDVQILNYIKDNLGFGSVIMQSLKQKTHRFIVQDINNLHLICLLFNGNCVLPVRTAKFVSFLAYFNEKLIKKNLSEPIVPIYSQIKPTLNDFWLCGFTDAEGCFSVTLNQINNKFQIRFILAQKWLANKVVLDNILMLFQVLFPKPIGYVNPHSVENTWELVFHGTTNCGYLFIYFDKFMLKTKKLKVYTSWKLLHKAFLNKEHLDIVKREHLLALAKSLNKV